MTWQDISQIATPLISVGTLIVTAYVAVLQRQDRNRSLSVSLSLGFTTGMSTDSVVVLNAGNRSTSDITATSCSLLFPGPMTVPFLRARLPLKLESGDGFHETMKLLDLQLAMREQGMQGQVEVHGVVTDATGRPHRSRKALMLDAG